MPTYPTTDPITATIQLAHGDVRIEARDREDTVVTVTPTDVLREADLLAAQQTRVTYADGALRVVGPRTGGGILRKPGSVQLTVALPSDSSVSAATGLGRVRTVGGLGDCHVRSGAGDIDLGDAASATAVTGFGSISAGHLTGNASCVTGSGGVRMTRVDGSAQVKNSNGDTWLGEVGDAVNVKSSNGSIVVDRAHGDVTAASANGCVIVGSAERGVIDLKTALGPIEVGIAIGTAARLDAHTSFGTVRNELDASDRPWPDDTTMTLSAQTSAGDIVIRRAATVG